jgi:diketogulonate reductase-like aldo/keto reductase
MKTARDEASDVALEHEKVARVQPSADTAGQPSRLAAMVSLRTQTSCGDPVLMPLVGLGTFRAKGKSLVAAVAHALKRGVRLLDTAEGYGNAADVAAGIAASGVKREDIFIVSKVAKQSMSAAGVDKCVAEQAALFGGYVDLMLLHWPGSANSNPKSPVHPKARLASWLALERHLTADADERPRVHAIGVSNFTVAHLKELMAHPPCKVRPCVNQVELHPFLPQTELREFCADNFIQLQAYTSLGRSTEPPKCLYGNWEPDLPRLVKRQEVTAIAKAVGKTPEQVLLVWALQHRIPVIPKAVTPAHIDQNCDVDFDLTESQMNTLDNLDQNGTIVYAYRPEKVPV